MGNENDKFEWFGWDEDPKGKYKQPKPNTNPLPPGAGYPEELLKDNVMVKGRWPSDTKMKTHMDIRGAGAATKGKQMTLDPE